MDFKQLVLKRESCRHFSSQMIEKEKLQEIIETAHLAPSACNSQPWTMHVVQTKELVEKIAEAVRLMNFNKFASTAPTFIVICEDKETFLPKAASKIKAVDYVSIDIGILAAHLVLSATSLGLSTCILGWFNQKMIHDVLGLPKDKKIHLVIAIGYPINDNIREKNRKPIEAIATYY